MNNLSLKDLGKYIEKTCTCYNSKTVNSDMLWKQNVMLKFIIENNIFPNNVLDIGAGEMSISMYLIKTYDCYYTGVDWDLNAKPRFLKILKNNNINCTKIEYYTEDFMKLVTSKKYDLIIDGCSMIHFEPTKKQCANDGLLKCGKVIKNCLTDDGYFLFTGDCLDINLKNHRGEKNTEYISKEQIIECFKMSGLTYIEKFTQFLSKEDINKSYNQLNLEIINKGWLRYDHRHVDHYDRVFLVFKNN